MRKPASAMKITKKDLKKLIDEEVKRIMGEEQASCPVKDEEKEAPVIAPPKPKEKEKTPPRPLKIPTKWPGPMPKPMPKAKKNKARLNEGFSFVLENSRMKELMQEFPMDVDPTHLGGPDPSIKSGIEGRKETPFSAVELFNTRALNKSVIEKLGGEEFNAIVRNVMDTEELDMMQMMNTYRMITTLERRHRRRLENLSLSIVKNKFGLPDDVIQRIQASLKNDGEIDPPGEGDDDNPAEEALDEFTPEQQAIIKKHIDKRIVHNALMMGAGYRAHTIFDGIKNSLDAIDDKLYPLYRKLMPNMELFLWKVPVDELFGMRQVLGKSELDIQPDGEVKAKAEATMFPILLHEVAKAAVEILFAQHLVDIWEKHGEQVYKSVLKKSESYLGEHWMKLIGPRLWKYLHDAIDYVVKSRNNDYTIVAYVLNRMATMEPEEFMALMNDIVGHGGGGDVAVKKIESIIDAVENDIENYENKTKQVPNPEDITPGENKEDEIAALLKQNEKNLLKTPGEEIPQKTRKKLEDMEIDELNTALTKALDVENFERAAKIRDIINKKTGRV